MGKQLILLVGLHKTATTSIQHTCAANQGILFRAGYAYPLINTTRDQDSSNHTQFAKWFRDDPSRMGLLNQYRLPDLNLEGGDAFLAQVALALSKAPAHLLMAAENISVFNRAELRRMKAWFDAGGWQVRVVCNVRHLGSWISSVIAQRVRSVLGQSIAQAVEEYRSVGSIVRGRIENIREVFPDARFLSHEAAVAHPGGPVEYFFEQAGIRPAEPLRIVRANERETDGATRLRSLIHERFGRVSRAAPDGLLPPEPPELPILIGGAKFQLTAGEVAPILPLLRAENDWLRSTLGERFFDQRLEFPERQAPWTDETLAQLEQTIRGLPAPVRDWVMANRSRLN